MSMQPGRSALAEQSPEIDRNEELLEGTLERIVFTNEENQFTVARVQPASPLSAEVKAYLSSHRQQRRGWRSAKKPDSLDNLPMIVGALPGVNPGERVRMYGIWERHPKHGVHFRVHHFQVLQPATIEEITRVLGSGLIKGIGPARAGQIVAQFGTRTLEVIEQNPQKLTAISGINAKMAQAIAGAWQEHQEVRKVMEFLREHDVDVALAGRIYRTYGAHALDLIRANPYRLEQDIFGVHFTTADRIAASLGLRRDSLERVTAGIRHVLSNAAESGHLYLPEAELHERASSTLRVATEVVDQALKQLLDCGDLMVDEDFSDRVYLAPFYVTELNLARRIQNLLDTPDDLLAKITLDWDEIFTTFEQRRHIKLGQGQREAIQMALRSKVSVLTGGPGTGKTTSLRALIGILRHYHISYCLAAPTGRAAKRLVETTGHQAKTIHRLLEYAHGDSSWGYNERKPLPYRYIIIDEASMLDAFLANRLLKAIAPQAHLLLVGDVDQLPSVGPGDVLRDIIGAGTVPVVRLHELFRQAAESDIVANAHRINAGEQPRITNAADSNLFLLREDDAEVVERKIVELVQRRLPARYKVDPLNDIQVIAPIYSGAAGVLRLNALLQNALNPHTEHTHELRSGTTILRTGDKVMQLRNNYEKGVYNGDIGRVVKIDLEERQALIEYQSESGPYRVPYEAHELDELTLAYAVSVHKAQGSEYPVVIMPLLTQQYPLLQRNLLYTAITRARKLCVMVGMQRALALAVRSERLERRCTGLADRLKRAHAAAASDLAELEARYGYLLQRYER